MRRDQLAINSVSTLKRPLEECLPAYAAAGFRHVEFAFPQLNEFFAAGHTPDALRQRLEDLGLKCIGGFDTTVTCFGDTAARQKNQDRLVGTGEVLAALGGSILVCGTDGPNGARPGDPAALMAEGFGRLADRLGPLGITPCLEFNWSPLVKSFRTAVQVARRTGRDNVGVLFDTAHYHCTPSKFEQINAANVPYIRHVHVNDMRDIPGEWADCNSDRVLPGDGCLDLPTLIGQIERHGYKGFFAIEMFSEELWAMSAEAAARRMYESLLPLCTDSHDRED